MDPESAKCRKGKPWGVEKEELIRLSMDSVEETGWGKIMKMMMNDPEMLTAHRHWLASRKVYGYYFSTELKLKEQNPWLKIWQLLEHPLHSLCNHH